MKNFTLPILCPSDRKMEKIWFVYFRFINPVTGKRQLFKYKAGLNAIPKKNERLSRANALIEALKYRLNSGWNPISDEIQKEIEKKTLIEHLQDVLNAKITSLTEKSVRSYNDIFKMFKDWMISQHLKDLFPQNFTPAMAKQYTNYLVIDKKYSGKTHNTQLGIIKSWFTDLQEIELIVKNPFNNLKELPEEHGKSFAFNSDEREKLKDHLATKKRRLYFACQFLYFLLIRPKELIRLKVEDINFENNTIVLHSARSKNRSQQSVTIPKSLEKIIYEMGLDLAPKSFFIFGRNNFSTCEQKLATINHLSGVHRAIARHLKVGEEKSLYSWKHTGACALYNATKDPYLVMQQCRHSDIKITMIYLRSLGLTVNEKIREAEYSF